MQYVEESLMTQEFSSHKHLYSSAEVCKEVGITYRQLDYWTRKGWVSDKEYLDPAPGSGVHRNFSEKSIQLRILKKAAKLKSFDLPTLADYIEDGVIIAIPMKKYSG